MSRDADTMPFSRYEWMLAGRYLRARRKEGFISVIAGFSFIGVMLGVATLIVVMSVMNGFRKELFSKIMGLNGHVVVYRVGPDPFKDYTDAANRLQGVKGVSAAMPLVEGQVVIASPTQTLGGLVRGLSLASLTRMPLIFNNVREGSLSGFDTQEGIAIGTQLARALRVNVGDGVTLIAPKGATTPFGTMPANKRYLVAAIFEMGMSEYDKTMIFMPLGESQRYFRKGDSVDVLEVLLDDPEAIDTLLPRLQSAGGPSLYFSDWRKRNETFFTVLEVERNVMFIILSLIVLVAALNIISGLMMLVKDKGRDIAVLRTMGATKGAMMRVFLITGASIGVVGTIAGFILGVLLCWNIDAIRKFVQWVSGTTLMDPTVYYLTRLPADINPRETAGIIVMALALSVIATIYPSWRASKLDPVEALRYE